MAKEESKEAKEAEEKVKTLEGPENIGGEEKKEDSRIKTGGWEG